jgi:hypothetical protein
MRLRGKVGLLAGQHPRQLVNTLSGGVGRIIFNRVNFGLRQHAEGGFPAFFKAVQNLRRVGDYAAPTPLCHEESPICIGEQIRNKILLWSSAMRLLSGSACPTQRRNLTPLNGPVASCLADIQASSSPFADHRPLLFHPHPVNLCPMLIHAFQHVFGSAYRIVSFGEMADTFGNLNAGYFRQPKRQLAFNEGEPVNGNMGEPMGVHPGRVL